MKIHHLKTESEPYGEVVARRKTAELRINDRDFKVGDRIILFEIDSEKNYTGNSLSFKITHIQTGYGLKDGYVMLSITPWVEHLTRGEHG